MANRLNLVGKKFGRLKVLKYAYTKNNKVYWWCLCDCGNEAIVTGNHLTNGDTKSCGCLQIEETSKANKGKIFSEEHKRKLSEAHKGKNNPNYKHGLWGTKEYFNSKLMERKARKLNQTPANAGMVEIQKMYSYCAKLNETGVFRYEVDHIKPLSKGGLHHQDNLQILLAKLNHEKNAKWPLTKIDQTKYKGITLKDLEFKNFGGMKKFIEV